MSDKVIFTIDVDAFFASCEEARHPEFRGMPIIIGNVHLKNKGIVGACNYPARKHGVHSGMPIYKAKRLCAKATIINSDYEYYVEKSEEIFQIIASFSKQLEVASIDECYLDVTTILKGSDPIDLAWEIQQKIQKETGLTVSIGISDNKLLSKIASKFDKPHGISTLYTFEIEQKLWPLPIFKMQYIGKATTNYLQSKGINYIVDLINLVDDYDKYQEIKKALGIRLDEYISSARGKTISDVNRENHFLKSISFGKTFTFDLVSSSEVVDELFKITKKIVARLEYRALTCRTIALETKDKGALNPSSKIQLSLEHGTNSIEDIWSVVMKLYDTWYTNQLVRFIAISVNNLEDALFKYTQMTLDDLTKSEVEKKINSREELLILDLNQIVGYEAFSTLDQFQKLKRFNDKSLNSNDRVKFKRWEK